MNNITLVGRITKDLELVENESSKYVKFNIAVNRMRTKDKTDFIPIIVWGNQAENLVKFSGKGKLIAVNGSLHSNPYSKDGENKVSFEVNADYVKVIEWNKTEDTEE